MEKNIEKEIKGAEKERMSEKVVKELFEKKKEELEKKELLTEREKIIREKLEKEIEKMKLNPELEKEAKEKAKEIERLEIKGKLKQLLDLAEEKGVAFAVGVAKNIQDPYTLDILHDILAREELYKKFSK